jgi:hypothetical protein
MDESTTDSAAVDTGVQSTQPDAILLDEPAANSPEQQETTTTNDEPSEPDENSKWLQSKGIDKSAPDWEAKLIQNAREAERLMSQRASEAARLQNALAEPVAQEDQFVEQPDPVSQLQAQVESLQLTQSVKDFFAADGDATVAAERKAYEPQMAEVVTNNPMIGQLIRAGGMSYDQLFALAKGSNPDYAASLKQDGGREALQEVVNKQQARANPGVATTSALSGDTKGDAFLDGFNSI